MVLRSLISIGLLCVVSGCGDTSKDSGSNAAGASAGQGGAAMAGGAGDNGKGGGASGGNGVGTGGAAGAAGANAGAGGGGDDCRVTPCADGLSCVPNDGVCGSAGSTSCLDLSTVTCVDRPVCGCDQTIYESNCTALEAGVFIAPASYCTTPEGSMACLNAYCDKATEYCNYRMHYGPSQFPMCNAGPAYGSGVCHPLPAECDGECNCVTDEPFVDCPGTPNCQVIDGAVTRSCLSGCYG